MKIWKLFYIDESDNEFDVFHNIELIPEEKLNDRLQEAVWNAQLSFETVIEYKLETINLYKLTPKEIAKIFKFDGYNIESVEV